MNCILPLLFLATQVRASASGNMDADALLNDSAYSESASSAITPLGNAAGFVNTHASASGKGYLTYSTLADYDPNKRAERCNNNKHYASFNIFFKRYPPKTSEGLSHKETVVIKCFLWSRQLSLSDAEIVGQWRNEVIAGSNAYINV
ncbi:hypothetical protein F53441_8066 [Fusarium austroafricanum]|uniref:Uncharacterized protein n=1 Tax=Fusarium austroafricanum TaxID=2364996 RepID=A0A8H4KC61_9HYPO|nr:hypothetical protein F53441_8066 [Fusarium austroafricanum]